MPSPIGHALAGLAAGWAVSPRHMPSEPAAGASSGTARRVLGTVRAWRWPLVFAGVGMAADLDLLVGLHSRYTHSVGAALVVLLLALAIARQRHVRAPVAFALALAAAFGSHVLLDWLADDTTPPIGIMALWPFDEGFHNAPVHVFMRISRSYWLPVAWRDNSVAVLRELLILGPIAALVWRLRGTRGGPRDAAAPR